MIPHLAWSVISTVKRNFITWETRDWSWKPANFSTKPLAETQWKRADTFKSTEALRKHETMPPFSSYTFPAVTVLRKRNRILNHQVSATFPNCGNTLLQCQGLQILLMSGVTVTSASQILGSFWKIWSHVSQRKKPFSDFPERGPGMYNYRDGYTE